MAVRVYIPTPYRDFTDGKAQVEIEAQTVGELLQRLAERYGGLRERIFGDDGQVAAHLNVYVNQEEIRSLQGVETPLNEGDEVALIPAMAGGAQALTDEQLKRYSRHVLLPEIGIEGQKKLLASSVALVGAGGLGSPAAVYLAAAGVGTLGIIDADRVDLTNLQRQILHFTHDVGRPKTQSARRHIEDLNPDVQVIEHRTLLTSENALDILRNYDVVINGSDNFPTRYLVNDACVMLGKPLVDASILKFEGQMTVFAPGKGCYRCLFPSPPPPGMVPSCAQAGIVGALAGHMGTLQAMEAIKLLLGIGEPLTNRLLIYDALAGRYHTLRWRRNPNCPVCGDNPTITELIDYEEFCGMPMPQADDRALDIPVRGGAARSRQGTAGNGMATATEPAKAVRVEELRARSEPLVTPEEVAQLLREGAVQLIDVREPQEFRQMHIKGARLIPLAQLRDRLDEIDPDRPAVFVCTVGERSGTAVAALRRAGLDQVYNLKGGMMGWLNSQLPVESGDPT